MLYDLKDFKNAPAYIIVDDKIGYKDEEDQISFVISYGYRTMFAYYDEYTKKRISEKSLIENVGILIKYGNWSYAEIPYEFHYIMGVSGNLY